MGPCCDDCQPSRSSYKESNPATDPVLFLFCIQNNTHLQFRVTRIAPSTTTSQHNKSTKAINMPFTASDICKIILAVLLPPLGVFLERGCGADLLINILLTILGYIPGIIHALYVLPFSPGNTRSHLHRQGLASATISDPQRRSLLLKRSLTGATGTSF